MFFWTLIASLAVTAAIAIVVLLFADLDETTERILATTGLVSLSSLLALPGGVLLDQNRFLPLAWADLTLTAALFVFATTLVWTTSDDTETPWKALGTLAMATLACAQVAAATSRLGVRDDGRVQTVYWASIALVVTVAAMAWTAMWAEVDDENFYRVLGALVVADVFSVLVQPILRRVSPGDARRQARANRLVCTLAAEPSDEAVRAAIEALERAGVPVERAERTG